jgi:hypothetical protein
MPYIQVGYEQAGDPLSAHFFTRRSDYVPQLSHYYSAGDIARTQLASTQIHA